MTRFAAVIISLFFCSTLFAQVSRDLSVDLDATVTPSPTSITLHWKPDATTSSLTVHRRLVGAASWGAATTLDVADTTYTAAQTDPAKEYEFRIIRKIVSNGVKLTAYGYIRSGASVSVGADQGACILLVDSTYATALALELDRLKTDLLCEGFRVLRIDVARTDNVISVKDKLRAVYESDRNHISSLFIFGHVPVAYSGFLNPDGHPEHYGAWPSDLYYSEFDGDWTDDDAEAPQLIIQTGPTTFDTVDIRAANYNITGDNKFDQTLVPDDIDLRTGRVDLYNMPSFAKSDTALLRQYLDKDHAYRIGLLQPKERAVINDNFGYLGGEGFASSGFRNFAPIVGRDNMIELTGSVDEKRIKWLDTLQHNSFLWAYGTGGGWDQGSTGVCTTADFAARDSMQAVFTMLFGSYFGDWNVVNNFLRAPLCTSTGLSCAWSGRPYWHFFPMAMGHTLGEAAQLSQNNSGDYVFNYMANGVHINLMGDPTLRMRNFSSPSNVKLTDDKKNNQVRISWSPDIDIPSYVIFRSGIKDNYFKKIGSTSGATFNDDTPLADSAIYLIRGLRNELTPSGSYQNLSHGRWVVTAGGYIAGVGTSAIASNGLRVITASDGASVTIELSLDEAAKETIEIVDLSGHTIKTLNTQFLTAGLHTFNWKFENVPSGTYLVRASNSNTFRTEKIIVTK